MGGFSTPFAWSDYLDIIDYALMEQHPDGIQEVFCNKRDRIAWESVFNVLDIQSTEKSCVQLNIRQLFSRINEVTGTISWATGFCIVSM